MQKTVIRQLVRYGRESFSNGVNLLSDAIRSYNAKRWGTAFFLSTISLEEIGKCLLANDAIFDIQANKTDTETIVKRMKSSTNHRRKQLEFAKETMPRLPTEFIRLVLDKQLERAKQKALYVDMELLKKERMFFVTTPAIINEAKARRMICLSHESILDLVQGSVDENYIFEMGTNIAPLDKKNLLRIKKMWNRNYKAKRSSFNEEIINRTKNSA